jgi:F-type H+-transporting ATPase subunit epsilon
MSSNKKLNLKIITPDKILVDEQADIVSSVSVDGEFAVLPDHVPYMTALNIGVTKYKNDSKEEYVSTIGGIFQIDDNNVTILTEAAELGEEIDIPRAKAAQDRAEARLRQAVVETDVDRAQTALARALVRLKAASKVSGK